MFQQRLFVLINCSGETFYWFFLNQKLWINWTEVVIKSCLKTKLFCFHCCEAEMLKFGLKIQLYRKWSSVRAWVAYWCDCEGSVGSWQCRSSINPPTWEDRKMGLCLPFTCAESGRTPAGWQVQQVKSLDWKTCCRRPLIYLFIFYQSCILKQ